MIDKGRLAEADSFIIRKFSRGSIVRSQQTLGDVRIHWQDSDAGITGYERDLDLQTGLATTTWKRGGTSYAQEVFCSNPDEALFIHLKAEGPDTLDFTLRLDRPLDQGHATHLTKAKSPHTLHMQGKVTQRQGSIGGKPLPDMGGVEFSVMLHIDTVDGNCAAEGNALKIRGAKEAVIRLTASTSFWPETVRKTHHQATERAEFQPADTFAIAKKKHITDHRSLYLRCTLQLPDDPTQAKKPTDQRLAALSEDQHDRGLEALIFHYGRYLLIASSRKNGNPANLQGLWNPHIEAPWNNDYHLNINLQMNYWPAEVTNLSETHEPVFTWMQALARRGAVTAKKQYGMRGWMSHHASELRAPATMKSARAQWGGWIHGGGWMCQHIWTHYAYTGDKKFLEKTGYPLLKGQARFYLDWLTEKDGKLISSPESSPENGFLLPDGKFSAVCAKAAMGQQIITELLTNTLVAARELGINDPFTREIEEALPKLDAGLHIGADGRILEWDKPYKESEPGHRHLSHLYAFHPGISITHEKTPHLMEAVQKSIAHRAKHGSVGVGWSRAWAVNIYARLRDGDTALHHLREMLRTQTLSNGFNSIFGKNRPLFQIEANLGATAGVAEMLIQSHGGFIHLLPALPKAWPEGAIKGLRARGGYTIDLIWKNGEVTDCRITHPTRKTADVHVNGKIKTITCRQPYSRADK